MAKKAQEDRVFIQNAVKTLATNIRFASVDNPVHSIVVSPEAANATIAALQGYQQAGYALVLPGHTMPEDQQAVADKIAYLQKLKEIAGESSTADEFKIAMLEAFPGYSGENYLEMTAGYLFPEA